MCRRNSHLTLSFIVAVLLAPVFVRAAATTTPASYTRHDYLKSLLAHNRRTLIEPYKQIGKRDPKWDEDAIKLLEGEALKFTNDYAGGSLYALAGAPPDAELIKAGESARAKGCDDPLVAYCYGVALTYAGRDADARPFFAAAPKAIADSHYPIIRAMFAAWREFHLEIYDGKPPETHDAAWTQFRDALLATFTSWKFQDIDRRILFDEMYGIWDEFPPERLQDLAESAAALQGADPWLVDMFGGKWQVKAAWQSRGSDWAHTVTDQGWRGFYDHLSRAQASFDAAHKLHPDYPEAAAEMITVAMGAGDQLRIDPRTWFDRAVAAQIDYAPAYDKYLYAITPRWGGSALLMHRWGVECLNTRRFDTDVPWRYVETVERILRETGTSDYWQQPGVYENVKAVCDGYARTMPAADRNFYPSFAAAVAWRIGKYDDAVSRMDELGERFDPSAMSRLQVLAKLAMSHAYANSTEGSEHDTIAAAESRVSAAQLDQAIEVYEKMTARHDKADDKAGYFLACRLKQLRWQKQFDAGEWVDIQPDDAQLLGWSEPRTTGQARRDPADGSVVLTPTTASTLFTFQGVFMGPRFAVEATIDPPPEAKSYRAGMMIGSNTPFATRGVWMEVSPQRQVIDNDLVQSEPIPFKPANAGSNGRSEFRMTVFDDQLHLEINGRKVFVKNHLEYHLGAPRLYVALCATTDPPGSEVKFRKLRIRAVDSPPEN